MWGTSGWVREDLGGLAQAMHVFAQGLERLLEFWQGRFSASEWSLPGTSPTKTPCAPYLRSHPLNNSGNHLTTATRSARIRVVERSSRVTSCLTTTSFNYQDSGLNHCFTSRTTCNTAVQHKWSRTIYNSHLNTLQLIH